MNRVVLNKFPTGFINFLDLFRNRDVTVLNYVSIPGIKRFGLLISNYFWTDSLNLIVEFRTVLWLFHPGISRMLLNYLNT